MTPILDGMRRLGEYSDSTQTETPDVKCDATADVAHSNEINYSTDSTISDTFQSQDSKEIDSKIRRASKTDSSDLSSLRNLSTNGLMMFDPLVINAVSSVSTESNRLFPDQNLVSSLNEQVTEIADRLSSIVVNDSDNNLDHSQMHSYSTNDVPTLISTDCSSEAYGFSGPRNDQLSCMPSTSHGYLIPNAISQEPVVLASLSHNNSAVFNNEDESATDINGAILNSDLSLMIPDNIGPEIVHTNISIANANLTSLLYTNEEFRQNFLEPNVETPDSDNNSFHSAKMTIDKENVVNDRVKFMLGYESDSHEVSPGDSGVSTENTSLDRSPDTDQGKEIKDKHYMKQNRVLSNTASEKLIEINNKNTLENSFSDNVNSSDLTVNINYQDEADTQKNEAGSSSQCVSVNDVNIDRSSDSNSKSNNCDVINVSTDVNNDLDDRSSNLTEWSATATQEDYRTLDEVLTEIRRQRENDKKLNGYVEDGSVVVNETLQRSAADGHTSTSHNSVSYRRQKVRKASSKAKKRKGKMWSPGIVIIDNRSSFNQNSPLRLNLDHFVDER